MAVIDVLTRQQNSNSMRKGNPENQEISAIVPTKRLPIMERAGIIVAERSLRTEVPSFLRKHAEIIPPEIRAMTSMTLTTNDGTALKHLKETAQEGVKDIFIADTDGGFVDWGCVFRPEQVVAISSANKKDSIDGFVASNRQPWFPLTKEIGIILQDMRLPLVLGVDQQNPYNKNNPNREELIDMLEPIVREHEGNVRISTIADVLNLLPFTWNDAGFLGISNAFFPQFIVKRLVERGALSMENLPQINAYAVNPLIKKTLTVEI